ncbi:hypothetical protein [Methylobacterium sp. 1973]|uniref:hypothetical protein n=1 Tax=Methylobacterium sp. 1973 TaxID=3156421 RepID=UPI003396E550
MTASGRDRETLIAQRRASRRGRPRGSTVPLLQHPRRFETAAWTMATLGLGLGPANAAAAVAGVFSTRPIRAEAVGELLIRLSTGIDHATLKGRADSIRRRAEAAVWARTDAEEAWLVGSCGALLNLVTSEGDAGRMAVPLMELRELGWGPTLLRIAARINAAARSSNLPPADGPIPRQALRLAEALTRKAKTMQ